MSLTPKQELFCQKYVELGNASEAYRQSFPNSNKWKNEAVTVNASKLLATANVLLRVKELQSQLEKKHELTKDKILDRLKDIIFNQESIHDGKIDLNAINKAIDTINKMQGFYAPEKQESVISETAQLPEWFVKR